MKQMFEKYNLELIKCLRTADGASIRSHVLVVRDVLGHKYSAKIFDSKDTEAKKRFVREIRAIRKIRAQLPNRYKSWVPSVKWYSVDTEHPYYIYEHIEGEQLGKFVEDFGIKWGYFDDRNFGRFINFFDNVSELKLGSVEKEIGNWGFRTARKEIQYYFENVTGLLPSTLYDKVRSFIESKSSTAFKHRIISHRDLYPENILIKERKSRDLVVLDWEYVSKVPIGFNAAFFYLLFWREEYWRAKVFSHYYNKYQDEGGLNMAKTFSVSFRFCLITLAIRFLYQLETYGDKAKEDYGDAKKSFLYDLESSLEGDIVKPRTVKFYLTLKDVKAVAKEYGIEEIKNYEVFYASKGNAVVRVDTRDQRYIFRFYSQSRSKSLILKELRIFESLSKCGIPTYDVVLTLDGKLYLEYKLYGKRRKIAVLTYVRGKRIQRRWANEKAARELGAMLRRVHNCGIVHGDYSKENVLFVKSKVTGVIDFEWGRFTKSKKAKFSDMAKAMALWVIDVRSKRMEDTVFVTEFLRGYYGYMPKGKELQQIMSAVIAKIEEERQVFLTTIDKRHLRLGEQNLGHRFDSAIGKVRSLTV